MNKLFLLFLLLIMLTGCAVKVPVVSTYILTAPIGMTQTQATQVRDVLLVSNMIAAPGYKTDQMIYVTSPANLRNYSRNAWVAPPAQMFMPLIAEHIEAKRYFRAVVTPPFAGGSQYRLDTRLLILQQEFMQPVSQVRCVIQAVLVNSQTGQVIASRRFQSIVPAPGNNPQSGVAAANQAAEQIMEQMANFTVTARRGITSER